MPKKEEQLGKIDKIIDRPITDEMRESYLSYAMSVIVARALPDVRDGLKPVQRRILYTMYKELGLRHNGKFVKSARISGETMGKYHPHGDASVYDAMARMAQDFSMRYMLVKGQGNFGSVDGDPPAAPRYTEAKLTVIAEELLADIEKDTVDFVENYDNTRHEPSVLPSRVPGLLLNGTLGIAVGMATKIPPHNLGELIDAINHLADNPQATINDLTNFIQGPDFPTGGIIYNKTDITNAYATGRGGVIMRGVTDIEEMKNGFFRIIITEIPYQVNKSSMIEKMAELVKDKKIDGIRDIRDESDKDGTRVVVELKQDAFPKKVLNQLFKYTDLQTSFHFNMVALIDGIQPQLLNLKSMLEQFISHRKEVVRRRSEYDLAKAKARAHILEGLKKALDYIDEIIKIIKKSASREDAFKNLIIKFKFTEVQTNAILDMRLQSLAGLERKKIEDELEEKRKLIAYLEDLLKSPKKMLSIIKSELNEIREKYNDPRRTKVIKSKLNELGDEDLIPEETSLFVLTHGGYIKRMSPDELKAQKRGGKGLISMSTKEDDVVEHFFIANTHDTVLFFTNSGKVFRTTGYEVPEGKRVARGRALVNFLEISNAERVTAVIPVPKEKISNFLFMTTKYGIAKKVKITDFDKVRRTGMIAITIREDDELGWVKMTSGNDDITLTTSNGNAIRFEESKVRPMGRSASGVIAIKLEKDAIVQSMDVVPKETGDSKLYLMIITQNGYGKRTDISKYKKQNRGGVGLTTAKITAKTGQVITGRIVDFENDGLIIISAKGQIIRIPMKSIPVLGRATQGVRVMRLATGDKVASVVVV